MKFIKPIPLLLIIAALLAVAPVAMAGSHTWNGAVNGYWSNNGNWSAGGAPAVGESNVTLLFPAGAIRYNTTNNIVGLEVNEVTFNGDYTVGGSGGATLTVAGFSPNIAVNGSHVSTIASSLPVVLNSSLSVYVFDIAGRLTISSAISGTNGVGFGGGGTLVFSGTAPNTFEGITHVTEGELRLGKSGAGSKIAVPGRLVIGTANMANPATVRLFDNHQIGNNNTTLINESGTLDLNGYVDSVGQIDLWGGAITTDDGADFGSLALNDVVNSMFSPINTASISGHISLGSSTRTFNIDGGTLQIHASIEDVIMAAGIIKEGPGTLALYNQSSYDGHTTVNEGYIALHHAGALGLAAAGAAGTTVNSPGELVIYGVTVIMEGLELNSLAGLTCVGNGGWIGDVVLNTESQINVYNGGFLNLGGAITGPGELLKIGLGTLRLSGPTANTFSGGTHVEDGTLELGKNPGIIAVPGPLVIGESSGPVDSDIVLCLEDNQIFNDAVITIEQSGLLDLNDNSDAVGPITLIGGDIETGSGLLGLRGIVTAIPTTNTIPSINGRIGLNLTNVIFDVQHGLFTTDLQIGARISGSPDRPLVKTGPGIMTLLNTNNIYTGLTLVQQGWLELKNGANPGSPAAGTIVSNGATLRLLLSTVVSGESLVLPASGANDGAALNGLSGTNWWIGPVTLAGHAGLCAQVSNAVLGVSGLISGPYNLSKYGLGTVILGGDSANTYEGTTWVNAGVLQLSKVPDTTAIPGPLVVGDNAGGPNADIVRVTQNGQIHDLSTVIVTGSGLLDLNGKVETIGSLAGAGRVTLGFGFLHTGGNDEDTTFSGSIQGVIFAGMTKHGTGKMTLTGTNDYPGRTLVNGGSLFVNGQQTSGANVNPGATLNGCGTVGAIAVTNGTVSPGNEGVFGPGLARLNSSNVVMDAASSFRVDLAGTEAGTNYSQLDVNGIVNLGDSTLCVKLAFPSAVSNQFVIIDNDGFEPVNGTFKGLPHGAVTNFNSAYFVISYFGGNGNDVVLTQLSLPIPPEVGGVTQLPDGQVQLNGVGIPGLLYTVEANTDLTTTNWVNIGIISAPDGVLMFTDADAPNHPQRFYRLLGP